MDATEELAWRLCGGAQEEYVRDLSRRMADMLRRGVTNPDEYRVLASRSREAAMAVWAEHEGEVTDEVRRAFMEAMSDADEELVGQLREAHPEAAGLTNRGREELAQAARGMARIIARDNVSFADGQADTFNAAVAEAVTDYQMGEDYRTVMERAVRRMSSLGVVEYRSGQRSQVDVMVRRHVMTQATQARARDTLGRCAEYGHDLVMVDRHYGARPSHAVWQGRVYSLGGHDRRYPGLRESTGYGTAAGLCGANCRHFMTPYVPGLSQIPDVTPGWEERFGMPSDEFYRVTQQQRALERRVRALKRTVAMGQEQGLDMVEDSYRLGDAQARLRAHCERYGLQRDYERERAYGVSQQPVPLGRGKTTRTWTEFLDSDDTKAAIRSSGLTLSEGRELLRTAMGEQGRSALEFSHDTQPRQLAWCKSSLRKFANGMRTSAFHRLSRQEVESVTREAESIGVDTSLLDFNEGTQTGYSDRNRCIYVRGDVLPDEKSNNNRDRLSVRAVIAHEYYGHYMNSTDTGLPPEHWADEFRASYRAALDTPNLTDEERRMLMIDAYERGAEAGVKLRHNASYVRIVYGYGEGDIQ